MQYSTALALLIRVAIALATCTFFQPDEYFQALEPAHYLVFGYGDLTWEWTSKPPIRTILYPALNIPIYWLQKCAGGQRDSDTYQERECCGVLHLRRQLIG